jgi:hypothetical protein
MVVSPDAEPELAALVAGTGSRGVAAPLSASVDTSPLADAAASGWNGTAGSSAAMSQAAGGSILAASGGSGAAPLAAASVGNGRHRSPLRLGISLVLMLLILGLIVVGQISEQAGGAAARHGPSV